MPKKDQLNAFHQHLNSINANIQLTLKLEDASGYGLPFLDTVTSRRGAAIQFEVYRKPTHTDRDVDFLSHHPLRHKRSVVKTLLLRARNIPSTSKGKREEAQRVKAVVERTITRLALSRNAKERWQQNHLSLPRMVM